MNTLQALEVLKGTSQYWTEEEARELTDLEKWIQDLQYMHSEEERREKQAGIITLEINNKNRVIYTRELKEEIEYYLANGKLKEQPDEDWKKDTWRTEAKKEADRIRDAIEEETHFHEKEYWHK